VAVVALPLTGFAHDAAFRRPPFLRDRLLEPLLRDRPQIFLLALVLGLCGRAQAQGIAPAAADAAASQDEVATVERVVIEDH